MELNDYLKKNLPEWAQYETIQDRYLHGKYTIERKDTLIKKLIARKIFELDQYKIAQEIRIAELEKENYNLKHGLHKQSEKPD
jgi:hypothetical protein